MALFDLYRDGGDPYEKIATKKWLKTPMPYDNKPAYDILKAVTEGTGFTPAQAGGSIAQEGGIWATTRPNERSEAYFNAKINDKEYPVDGFYNYGLDTFSSAYPELRKKGYLSEDFNFKPYEANNEKGEKVLTAAFKTNEDAMRAKVAYMRHFRDQVQEEINKKGLKVDSERLNYLTLAGYNAGIGNAKKLINELAEYKGKNFEADAETKHSWLKKNIAPRKDKRGWIEEYEKEIASAAFGKGTIATK